MKQHLYEPTLFLRDGKEWIKGFTMERPSKKSFYPAAVGMGYEDVLSRFEASAVEYPVCEGSRESIRSIMNDWKIKGKLGPSIKYYTELLDTTGIRIDELADRLEIRRYKVKDGVTLDEPQSYVCLRPEVKEENPKLYTKDQVEHLCRSAFEAGRSYQMGEYSEYHGGHEHDYPNKENWIKNNIK